ncbi:MAG: universal stress protein [Deltaproteobacteria bacterium]|nr:universal stress protein [Deltaproteobacteria bacterium]
MKHIVVPVDGSEQAARAALFAAQLASPHGAQITLLFVYDAPAAVSKGLAGLAGAEGLAEASRASADAAFGAALAVMADVVESEPEQTLVVGSPAVEIITFTERSAVDLVVMGSRGMSSMEGLVMGSVSERVMRGARCPVTIVR